ncbi:MAG TPA: DinB family protein [Thermoanaerobaculia bacterium]
MTGRPLPGEYGEHAASDIACVAGDDALEALLRQQREFEAFLGRLDETHIAGLRYAPGKWTVKQVIGHMLDDERIFAYRMLCIARGDTAPLESFDENRYVTGANFEERPLASFIDEYRLIRASTIALLRPLTPEAWLRRGTVAGYTASVRGLAWHIAGHELHHIEILKTRYLTAG